MLSSKMKRIKIFLIINLIYWILLCSYPFVFIFSIIMPHKVVWVIREANRLLNFFRWSNSFRSSFWK